MEHNVLNAVALGSSLPVADFSVWAMFLNADWVVKLVMILLVLASIWSWAIIFEKSLTLRVLNRRAEEFESSFWSGAAIDDLYDQIGSRPRDPMSAVFVTAMREWRRVVGRRSADPEIMEGLEDRIERVMQITTTRELERIERYLTFLASTGSTAPFVGLFGTVWGIMHSFQAIALSKNTSLAVVAPGIAEALFATALGLLAAIPAVLAYNKLSRDVDRYATRVNGFAGEFLAILSRQMEDDR
jgi:biopolymer transport protein TolQ